MRHKLLMIIMLVCMCACPASGGIPLGRYSLNASDDSKMARFLPPHLKFTGKFTLTEAPEYSLNRMKQVNPDFTTYPEANGIIWLKHSVTARSESGGIETVRLYVILGRRGLGSKWLNWNIPIPVNGSTRVLEASVYDFTSLASISSAEPQEDTENGIIRVNFPAQGLPETFIIAVSWHEHLPSALSVEGLRWFQEDLRVWESVIDVYSPEAIAYRTFPDVISPERDNSGSEILYTWRRINIDPFMSSGELARVQRAGVIFSTRRGTSGVMSVLKDIDSLAKLPANSEALSGFKKSKAEGTLRLLEWLKNQPEIELAEGAQRKIPTNAALTQTEKILLAKSWLTSQKIDASLNWRIPFDLDDMSPLCAEMFTSPVLEVRGVKGVGDFHDMTDPKLLGGTKIYSVSSEGRVFSRRVPSSKSSDNRLSAVMDFRLTEQGLLNGTVRVILRGAWGALLLGDKPADGTARGAVLSLFPGLTNYKDVKYQNVKGVPEISFTIENKPGVGGTGRGVLAVLPFFEPPAMRKLGGYDAPVEVVFPFVIDQNITLGFPKNASEALVTNKVSKNPDKINYSESYTNRRHRLIAESRFELNMNSVTLGNMALLRRHLDQWRAFSARQIAVR